MLTSRFEIDVTPGGIPPVVNASQYDAGSRTIEFTLVSGTGDFVPPSGVKAEVRGTKPDGNGFSYEARILGRVVTVVITEQMTAVAGKVRCELALYTGTPATNETPASDDYMQLCTANFILMVERAALDKDTLSSASEIRQLVSVIDRSNEIIAAANRSDQAKEAIQRMIAQNEEGMQIMTAQAEHRLEEITQQTQDYLAQKTEETEAALGAIQAETIAARDRAIQSENAAAETLETVNQRAAQIVQVTTNADTIAAQAMERASNAENEAAETANALDQLNENVALIRLMSEGKVDDAYVENGYLYLTSN
ncbi:MAG: BppU family phage baseplate upper protein, partial [Eubacteriales bacterium]|nr:BppU family phage baseplate upper protein [Eubacteriales bacterium]